jgi:UDP:flavonoid glycosyltransferase YjiC (YdhE family)
VLCGTSFLHWCRNDGAPLPLATSTAVLERYTAIAQDFERLTNGPAMKSLNRVLRELGVEPVSLPLFDSVVALANAYLQLGVPSFEFPRDIPPTVSFVGTPHIIPNQAPRPSWANDLDGSRKVVLITQGTEANHNFGLLVAPTLAAFANEPDILVVATAGGRPVDAVPGPVPGNARLASYLPFEWLLPKVDVLVTNGGYGSVNQAMSAGIPLVTDVNAGAAWSGVAINLATNEPTPEALHEAVRTVLETPCYRARAQTMADEFRVIDTRSEILRIIAKVVADFGATRRAAPAPCRSPAPRAQQWGAFRWRWAPRSADWLPYSMMDTRPFR